VLTVENASQLTSTLKPWSLWLAEHVRQDLMLGGKEEVSSQEIGDLIMKYLKKLDRIAYIRFASVYRQFEEPEDFKRVLLEVKK